MGNYVVCLVDRGGCQIHGLGGCGEAEVGAEVGKCAEAVLDEG